MANEDFERGREYERVKSDLSQMAGTIIMAREDQQILALDSTYLLLRARVDRLNELGTDYEPHNSALVQATFGAADLARKELEKRLGPKRTVELDREYTEKYARPKSS